MTDADREPFILAVTATAELLIGRELSEATVWALWEDLAGYELPEVVVALRYWRRREQFFPRPAELTALMDEAREERERVARRALPPHEPTAEEQAAAEQARQSFFALVRSLGGGMDPRRRTPYFAPVSPEEQQAHEARKQAGRERLRNLPARADSP